MWREGQTVVERVGEGVGVMDSFAEMVSSLDTMSDCFWVKSLRMFVVSLRSVRLVEVAELGIEELEVGSVGTAVSLSKMVERWSVLVRIRLVWEERVLRVLACWEETASRNTLVEDGSGRALEMRGDIFLATTSEMREAVVSSMFSSMRKAAAWMALAASGGTFGSINAVRSMQMIFTWSYGSSGSVQHLRLSYFWALCELQMGPRFGLARRSMCAGSLARVLGVPDACVIEGSLDLEDMCLGDEVDGLGGYCGGNKGGP